MSPIDKLTQLFERFPGIGPRQARRFVQFLLVERASYRGELAEHIRLLASQTNQCGRCYRWFAKSSGIPLCPICTSLRRDQKLIFVVEKDADIENIERSGFTGLYFVLGGTIPLASDEPEKFIRLHELISRLQGDSATGALSEVILGLSATTEGDHTRQILQEKIRPLSERAPFTVSSLGRGLSTGSELEYADPDTIASALNSRI